MSQAIWEVTVHDGLETVRPAATDSQRHPLEQTLYDAHAARLYAYCWSLVGDDAAEAVKDTFAAVGRLGPPHGDEPLWLYALARAACLRRGEADRAFGRANDPDPLRRAAGRLRAGQREVLVLSAGEWLETPGIARLLGVATDTVRQLIQTATAQLERAVLDALMHEPMSARHDDVIAAFEKGRLPALLARRAPARPPALLRAEVLSNAGPAVAPPRPVPGTPPATAPLDPVPVTSPHVPLVVIGSPTPARAGRSAHRRPGRVARTTGVAAAGIAAAAAAGLFAAWPSADGGSPSDLTALAPTAEHSGYAASLSAVPESPKASPATTGSAPFSNLPGLTPSPQSPWPDGSGEGGRAATPAAETRPGRSEAIAKPGSPPPASTPATTPPATRPPTPPPTSTPTDPSTGTPSETPQPTPTPDPSTPASPELDPTAGH